MAELLGVVQDTPIPNLLVLAGIALIFLAIVGGLTDKVTVPRERQRLIGVVGAVPLVAGIGLHLFDGWQPGSVGAEAALAPTALTAQTATAVIEPTGTNAPVVELPVTNTVAAAESLSAPPLAATTQPAVEATSAPTETVAAGPALPGVETVPLVQLVDSSLGNQTRPATTFTPPKTLGRNL